VFAAFSADRIDAANSLRLHWDGEMSLATVSEFTAERLAALQGLSKRTCSTISVIEYSDRLSRTRFPVNRLRNIASQQCQSPYALLLDIDFTVLPRLDNNFFSGFEHLFLNLTTRTALVLPAFRLTAKAEAHPTWDHWKTKSDLKSAIDRGDAVPFNMNSMPVAGGELSGFYPGHGPTDYARWIQEEDFYMIRSQTSKFPYYYEPYVLLRTADLIAFDESFVHYGFNKVSYIHELAAVGTEFVVHPELFLMHTFKHEGSMKVSAEDLDLPCTGDDVQTFYKASIGHSCIGYFLRRLRCAYGFGLSSLEFSPLRSYEHAYNLYTDTTAVPCLKKCIYDSDPVLRQASNVRQFSSGIYLGEHIYEPPPRNPCGSWYDMQKDIG